MKAIAKPLCAGKTALVFVSNDFFNNISDLNLFACRFESQARSSPWDATEAVAHALASHEGREPVSSYS